MREHIFHVEFKSDIVLPATSNTQGNIEALDFIPGSNFLGMAATRYKEYQNSFDLFHSGKVRFGDATILHGNKETYKMPLSFFYEKTDSFKLKNQAIESLEMLIQAKQLRSGYITTDKEQVFVEHSYAQKSAYDKENRRSKESSMYGYKAIRSGTKWQFSLKIESISAEDEKLLIETLRSSTRLGKSKSAEYGQVLITHLKSEDVASQSDEAKEKETILYCNSRLALIDSEGNPTFELTSLCEGLTDSHIVAEKTQIRTSSFTPYNGVRQTKDYERVCINKGSVIVLKDISYEQKVQIAKGAGAFLSEGFGDILINPSFLTTPLSKLPHATKEDVRKEEMSITDTTTKFLLQRKNTKNNELEIANEVAEFINTRKEEYKNIKPSQWGNIRSIAQNSDDFFTQIKEYISGGAKKWDKPLIDLFEHAVNKHKIDKRKFVTLLAIHMPKENNKGRNNAK